MKNGVTVMDAANARCRSAIRRALAVVRDGAPMHMLSDFWSGGTEAEIDRILENLGDTRDLVNEARRATDARLAEAGDA